VRLSPTTAFVLVCFLLVIELHRRNGLLGFYFLFPAIILASVLFNRGAGIFAAALSTILLYLRITPSGSMLLPAEFILPVLLFALGAVSMAIVCESLCSALDRAAEAERAKDLLLRELGHPRVVRSRPTDR
jgi:hypothetical protein